MRLSTFGKPRVIACAENLLHYVALPRGLLKEVLDLFQSQGIAVDVTDHRFSGVPIEVDFHGDRRAAQTEAAKVLASFDDGTLCAPTAFGKTAVAAHLIAMRKVNTLVMDDYGEALMDDVVNFLRLVEAIRPWLTHIVIVGGWAHRLHRFPPLATVQEYSPLRTRDVDLAFSPRDTARWRSRGSPQ